MVSVMRKDEIIVNEICALSERVVNRFIRDENEDGAVDIEGRMNGCMVAVDTSISSVYFALPSKLLESSL